MEFISKLKLENKIVVTDPCYCYDPNQRGILLLEVQKGNYNCYVECQDKRIKEVTILLDKLNAGSYYHWMEVDSIFVDSAQAGIFNFSFHEELRLQKEKNEEEWEETFYKKICDLIYEEEANSYANNCFITSTGWGDGEYSVYVTKKDNKIVGIQIIYIEEEEEEEDWF